MKRISAYKATLGHTYKYGGAKGILGRNPQTGHRYLEVRNEDVPTTYSPLLSWMSGTGARRPQEDNGTHTRYHIGSYDMLTCVSRSETITQQQNTEFLNPNQLL